MTSERYAPIDEYENFGTAHMEAAAECMYDTIDTDVVEY